MGRPVEPVTDAGTESGIGWIELNWHQRSPYRPLVDHFAVYGSPDPAVPVEPATRLGRTVYGRFRHAELGPAASTWHYRVVTVDAAGRRSAPSRPVTATTVESVTVRGRPLVVVGAFDRTSLELALAPDGYARFTERFGEGVDFTAGVHSAARDWPYLHPGPADRWAGGREYRFRLRFDVDRVPERSVTLAVWLIDTHASIPGRLVVSCNGQRAADVALSGGATRGSLEGDATVPGSALRPSVVELPLPSSALRRGRNVVEFDKPEGSWHAYDAVGVFEAAR